MTYAFRVFLENEKYWINIFISLRYNSNMFTSCIQCIRVDDIHKHSGIIVTQIMTKNIQKVILLLNYKLTMQLCLLLVPISPRAHRWTASAHRFITVAGLCRCGTLVGDSDQTEPTNLSFVCSVWGVLSNPHFFLPSPSFLPFFLWCDLHADWVASLPLCQHNSPPPI